MQNLYKFSVNSIFTIYAFEFALCVVMVLAKLDVLSLMERWQNIVWPIVVIVSLYAMLAMCVIWIGMLFDCLVRETLSSWSRILWLVSMLLTQVVAALIYYYFIYKKQRSVAQSS